ncbi:MAG TPA: hypothetical protein VD902_05820, partial [Symbiobacteriaceae bacterium]|nr:hypothetical protein [Symbiobacteriaceae bacterium]
IKSSFAGRLIQIDVGMGWIGRWAAVGVDPDGDLWALLEGEEPWLMARDAVYRWTAAAQPVAPHVPEPARYSAGTLIRLYRAGDGSWAQYLAIRELTSFYDYPAYGGLFLTHGPEGWTARPGVYPAERVDRYGRPAGPGEVPEHLLE